MRPELTDGKTEWFLVTFAELRDVIIRLKTFMVRMFGDCGSERVHNTRSTAKMMMM